jgi:hypothetical protein
MKTDDLISILASDIAAPRPHLCLRLAVGAIGGAAVAAVAVLLINGARPDLGDLFANWRLMVKFAVGLGFAASAAPLSLRLARPFATGARPWLMLLPGPAILAAACLAELMLTPPESWLGRAIGANALFCLVSIPLYSALPFAGIVWAMREGAPASPSQAGMAAGAMASGIGAAIYALHCPDDSPLFLALWYVLAALAAIMAARIAGGRLLRW